MLYFQHFIADAVTIIGTMDLVFGQVVSISPLTWVLLLVTEKSTDRCRWVQYPQVLLPRWSTSKFIFRELHHDSIQSPEDVCLLD